MPEGNVGVSMPDDRPGQPPEASARRLRTDPDVPFVANVLNVARVGGIWLELAAELVDVPFHQLAGFGVAALVSERAGDQITWREGSGRGSNQANEHIELSGGEVQRALAQSRRAVVMVDEELSGTQKALGDRWGGVNFRVRFDFFEGAAQAIDVAGQAAASYRFRTVLQSFADTPRDGLQRKRLEDVIESAQTKGFNGAFQTAVRRDDDDDDVGVLLAGELQHF
jgi:hypothetical protein